MSNLKFDEATHTYTLNGKELISVTQLLGKHGLSTDYSMIKSSVLNAAAKKGTLIHKEIEEYIKNGTDGFTSELDSYKAIMSAYDLTPLASEKQVHNDIVAGTIDLIAAEAKGIVIIDIKTGAKLDKRSIAWQLSIYNYLAKEITGGATKLYAMHLVDNYKLVEIDIIPDSEIERLFDCERNGEIYKEPKAELELPEKDLAQIMQVSNQIAELKQQLEAFETTYDGIKNSLKEKMLEYGVKSYENDYLKITYVEPYTRETLDSKRIKSELPEVYLNYKKISNINDNVNITVRK